MLDANSIARLDFVPMAEIHGNAEYVETAKEQFLQAYYACQIKQLRLNSRLWNES